MRLSRPPIPALRPFVERVWAIDERDGVGPRRLEETKIERVLPTGAMHLVFRVSDTPLVVLDDLGPHAARREVGCAVVGGARSTFYVRDVSLPVSSVGAQFRPGAAALLFGGRADLLAETHTLLDDLWGRAARELRSRLAESGSAAARIALLESALAARLPAVRGLHPAVAEALAHFALSADVDPALERSGFSQRHFIALFRGAVGLGPKWATAISPTSPASSAPSPGWRRGRTYRPRRARVTTSRRANPLA
jgi:hypothetical protein